MKEAYIKDNIFGQFEVYGIEGNFLREFRNEERAREYCEMYGFAIVEEPYMTPDKARKLAELCTGWKNYCGAVVRFSIAKDAPGYLEYRRKGKRNAVPVLMSYEMAMHDMKTITAA